MHKLNTGPLESPGKSRSARNNFRHSKKIWPRWAKVGVGAGAAVVGGVGLVGLPSWTDVGGSFLLRTKYNGSQRNQFYRNEDRWINLWKWFDFCFSSDLYLGGKTCCWIYRWKLREWRLFKIANKNKQNKLVGSRQNEAVWLAQNLVKRYLDPLIFKFFV